MMMMMMMMLRTNNFPTLLRSDEDDDNDDDDDDDIDVSEMFMWWLGLIMAKTKIFLKYWEREKSVFNCGKGSLDIPSRWTFSDKKLYDGRARGARGGDSENIKSEEHKLPLQTNLEHIYMQSNQGWQDLP